LIRANWDRGVSSIANIISRCCSCGDLYTADAANWKIRRNRMVCLACAEELEESIEEEAVIDNMEEFLNERDLKTQNFDYLSIYEKQLIVGELSEKYVYEYERRKLKGTKYFGAIDASKAKDTQNGYDILSYTATGEEIRIEVKGTCNRDFKEFYISRNEVNCAKKFLQENQKYHIYCVSNILSDDLAEIKLGCIRNLFDEKNCEMTIENWKVNVKKPEINLSDIYI